MLMSRSDKSRSNMHVFRTLFTSALLLLCSLSVFAVQDYQLNAASTNWENEDFSVSIGGFYEYYQVTVSGNFWFNLVSKTNGDINASVLGVNPEFNGTDVTDMGTSGSMYYVEPAPTPPYYIIVWYQNTAFNSNNTPVVCASTTLPIDGTLFSAVPIAGNDTYVTTHTYDNVVSSSQATVKGGTLYISNDHSGDLKFIRATGGYEHNGDPVFSFSSTRMPFKVQLNNALQPGDVIEATLRVFGGNAADGNGLWFFLSVPPYVPVAEPTTSATTTSTASEWKTVSYTVTAGDDLDGQTIFYVNAPHVYTCFTNFLITRPSCEAPTSVSVNGAWDYFGGETISLTATPTGGAGSPTYQWQKLINSNWEDLVNGDISGATFSGVTTANLQIANCGYGNSGKYRCVVSTGSGCETASATATDGSEGYGVKVFALKDNGGTPSYYEFTRIGNTQSGSLTINLAANTAYKFKVQADIDEYGNNGTVNLDVSNWVCSTSDGYLTINSGLGGTFTITVDYSTGGNNSTLGIPEISVTYPRKIIYLQLCSDWKAAVAKYEIYYWKGGDNGWSGFMDTYACNGDIRYAEVPAWATNCMFIRFDGSKSTPGSWSDEWNRTGDLNLSASNDYYYSLSKGGDNKYYGTWDSFAPTTYTISFAGNGNTGGSMSNMVVNCGDDATLTAHTFTKTAYVFTGWKADVAVTINGSPVSAGTLIADGATLQNVTSDIALTAQWEEITGATIPGTVDKGNVTDYIASMTWYGTNDEYFDFGPTSGANTDRWAEWDVYLLYSERYIVSVVVDFPSPSPDGYQWKLQLLDGGGNEVATAYQSVQNWGAKEYTYSEKWDLSGVTPGSYTLRVTNIFGWAQPKLKSVTFTVAGLSFTYTKVPNQTLYGKAGDSSRAYGTIDNATEVTTGIVSGSTVSASGNVLTIGGLTITAPETETGALDDIPLSGGGTAPTSSCVWRFLRWENLPATVTTDILDVRAVYFPTFAVDYQTNGGTICDPEPYTHWYEYTGCSEDITYLPEDVRKEGYIFGGWYQNSTTLLFPYLTGDYFGDYAKGASCASDACDYRLKAHWLLPCDEAQIISKVTLTGQTTYTLDGYNELEYAGTPVISVSATTAVADVDNDGNNETGYKLNSAGDILFAVLKKGEFRIGDKIRVAITEKNTSRYWNSSYNNLAIYYGTSASDAQLLVNIRDVEQAGIYEYTLDADDVLKMRDVDANGVGVYRAADNGENPCVYSVEIFGCRDLIFDDNNGTHVWSDPLNWGPTYIEIPSYYQATRIIKPCVVDIDDAHALNAKLCKGGTHNGSLTINADAALEVTQRVSTVQGSDYNTLLAVAAEDLVIKSNASHQGALAHGDEGSNTHATIEFYARGAGYLGGGNPTWQYVGVPFSDVTNAMEHYYGSEMCRWIENTTGNAGTNWSYVAKTGELVIPFQGYALTNPSAKTFTNQGTLVPSTNQTLTLTCAGTTGYAGWNMFANSWMAPIDIEKFQDADFGDNVQKTVYLMNTGINNGQQADFPNYESSTGSAGQYVAVPIHTAAVMGSNKFIAPMQGFYLVTEAASTVTLRYDLVRNSEHTALSVLPNRAPRYAEQSEAELMPRLRIDVTGSRFADRLYVLENTNQTNAFDNGWDGYKIEGEDYAPQLMTRTGDLDLAVDVSPAFDGKQIAFRAGEDTEYTLHFSTTERGLVLRDLVTDVVTPIEDGGTYHFFASNRESAIRFVIGDNRQVPTGFDEQPVLTSDQILSLAVYTADGRLVLRRTSDFDDPLLLPQSGVYIFYMQTTTGVKIQKITF